MSFLDLPIHIRRRIYIAAGLVSSADIDILSFHLSFTRIDEFPVCSTPVWSTTVAELRSSLDLFLICRAIRSEASMLFFSSNRFHFWPSRDNARQSFALLCSFVQSAHGQLCSLVVNLNRSPSVCSCETQTWSWTVPNISATSPRALDQSLFSDAAFLKDWQTTTCDIGPLLPNGRLELALVCDSASVDTAKLVVSSLRHFPTLSQCHLRLCQEPHAGIQQIAREAALRATGKSPTASRATHFRMMDLPAELRLHILGYTDLVTPLAELQWDPTRKYHLQFRHQQCRKELQWWGHGNQCPGLSDWIPDDWPDYHTPGHCRIPRDEGLFHHSCRFRDCWIQLNKGDCFCQRFHASYSTALARCACWSPPIALFLVCRQFSQESLRVFFARNRIIVLPCGGVTRDEPPASSPPARFTASLFLRSGLAVDSMKHLRLLDLVFPPIDTGPKDFNLAVADWMETLEWTRSKLDLSRLTIRCEIADYFVEEHVPTHRRQITNSQYCDIMRGYSAICQSFMPLHRDTQPGTETAEPISRLRGLFIHLADPAFWRAQSATSTWRKDHAKNWRLLKRQVEEKFKQDVMGKDYNSLTAGKGNLKWAEWRWKLEADYIFRFE